MSHMQRQITQKQDGWQVETNEGTCYIPGDVVSVPDWLKPGVEVFPGVALFDDMLADWLRDYVSGMHMAAIQAIEGYYFARLSAPGYLDCTEWCAFKTMRAASEYLKDSD